MIKNIIKTNYEIVIKENNINIKNYKNIIDIDNKRISVLLNNCNLIIKGNNLIICAMDEYELLIKGTIEGIEWIR